MLIKCLPVGQMETNCYVVADEKTLECVAIDPGDETNTILDYIEDRKLKARAIFLTHGHFDHTGAIRGITEELDVEVWIHRADLAATPEDGVYKFFWPGTVRFYGEGDVIEIGSLRFHIIETPGHSAGSVTIRCEDALFTGDTLFEGSCGRTDLPGGDMDRLMASLRRISELPGNYDVYPGHMDATTLDVEKANNYYMRYARGL